MAFDDFVRRSDTRNDTQITPIFKIIPVHDPIASKKAGRPIFEDVEFVEIRIAGDANHKPCHPALSHWAYRNGESISYAERWSDQYARFKENRQQVTSGTPLDEAPFLTASKRSELKALHIYTVEALMNLDGRNLKALGMEGRQLKDKAKAYIDSASGSAREVELAGEVAALKQELENMRKDLLQAKAPPAPIKGDSVPAPAEVEDMGFTSWTEEELRSYLDEETGESHKKFTRAQMQAKAEALAKENA